MPSRLGLFLEHKYAAPSITFRTLKRRDRALADALHATKLFKTWLFLCAQEMRTYAKRAANSDSGGEDEHRRRLTRMEPEELRIRVCKALRIAEPWWNPGECV